MAAHMKEAYLMDNVKRIVDSGVCTGCGACLGCEHLRLERSPLGFDVPAPDDGCIRCGKCVAACVFDPLREDN